MLCQVIRHDRRWSPEADRGAQPPHGGRDLMPKRIHHAWFVFGTTFVVLLVSAAIRATPAVLIVPLERELGWSRATISSAVSVNLLLYGLVGPFGAAIAEKVGLRRTMALAMTTLASALLLATRIHAPWQLVLLWGVLVGAGTGSAAIVLGSEWCRAGSRNGAGSSSARSRRAPRRASSSSCRCSRASPPPRLAPRAHRRRVGGAPRRAARARDGEGDAGVGRASPVRRRHGGRRADRVPRQRGRARDPDAPARGQVADVLAARGDLLRLRRHGERPRRHAPRPRLRRRGDRRGPRSRHARGDGDLRRARDDALGVAHRSSRSSAPPVRVLRDPRNLAPVPAARARGGWRGASRVRAALRTGLGRDRSAPRAPRGRRP